MSLIEKLGETKRWLLEIDQRWVYPNRLELTAGMTLLLLLFHGMENWFLNYSIGLLAVAGLLVVGLRRSGFFWLLLALPLLYSFVLRGLDYRYVPNHFYLTAYWVLALALALFTTDKWRVLRWNARWIIGLCFAFATLWKLLAPEFADGRFLHFILLTDERFSGFAEVVVGLPREVVMDNAAVIQSFQPFDSRLETAELAGAANAGRIALLLSYWTIVVEGLLAVTFLAPEGRRILVARNVVLFIFIVTTYPIATVPGFARLLLILAFASCHTGNSIMRMLYLVGFIAVPLIEIPYVGILRRFI